LDREGEKEREREMAVVEQLSPCCESTGSWWLQPERREEKLNVERKPPNAAYIYW
jgi:hypothetical protein